MNNDEIVRGRLMGFKQKILDLERQVANLNREFNDIFDQFSVSEVSGQVPKPKSLPTPDQIEEIVVNVCNISSSSMFRQKRGEQPLPWARQLVMHFLLAYRLLTKSQIGRRFNRVHSTVIHGDKLVRDLVIQNGEPRRQYETCCSWLDALYSPVPRINLSPKMIGDTTA